MSLPITVVGRIADCLHRRRSKPFLFLYDRDGSHSAFSYGEVIGRSAAWAAHYRDLRLPARSRVVVVLDHSLDTYAAFVGAVLANLVPSMFAPPSPKQSVDDYFRTLGLLVVKAAPSAIVCARELSVPLRPTIEAMALPPTFVTPERITTCTEIPLAVEHQPEDVAFVQYSSGTTGLKKAVAITHQALLWQIDRYAEAINLSQDDVIASWLPLYHDMGLICCALLPLVTATPVAAISPFDWVRRPALLLDAVTAHRATLCWLPNFAYNFLAKNVRDEDLARVDLRSLRGLVNCSEPIMAGSHDLFTARYVPHGLRPAALATSYAMAENTFAVTSGGFDAPLGRDVVDASALAAGSATPIAADHREAKTLISSGSALPDTEVRILSDTGMALPDRQIGEISIASPALFGGYEDEDAPSVIGDRFRTGDLGYLANGQLYVTGRKKDLIIVGGKNLFPQDIETVIDDVDGVIPGRAAAFGVEDAVSGTERLVIVAETQETEPSRLASLESTIRERVAARADVAINEVCLVEHMWLTKSSSGKMARAVNRQRYLQLAAERASRTAAVVASAPVVQAPPASEPGNLRFALPVLGILQRLLGPRLPEGFGPNDPLITSGLLDSLSLATLVLQVEDAFGVRIPVTCLDVSHFRNVWAITRLLDHLASGETRRERIQEVNGVQQTDDRDKASARFQEIDVPVELLILGSSRVRHMSPQIARRHGLNAFNFWLFGARAEDWYCALQFVLRHATTPPRAVVLAVDIEAFSNSLEISPRLALSQYLARYLHSEEEWVLPGMVIPALTQDDPRFASIRNQFSLGQGNPELMLAWEQYQTDRFIDAADEQERPALMIADPHAHHELYTLRMQGFTALDPRRVRYFRELLQHCFARNIRVICSLAPLHPVLDAFLSETTTYATRLADLIALLNDIRNPLFTFCDTRVPSSFGGNSDDFQDAAHPGPRNSDRLLDFLLATQNFDRRTAGGVSGDARESADVSVLTPLPEHSSAG
jgi:acyl-CoA synthetase (AMP-forming)/AMP-acid ligase II/acyl carrier protein